MKKIFVYIVMIYVLSFLGFAQNEEICTYNNEEYNYSISYPEKWKLIVPNEYYHVVRMEFRVIDSTKQADLSIRVMMFEDTDFKSAIDAQTKVSKMLFKNFKEIKNEKVNINGYDCIWQEITYDDKFQAGKIRYGIICAYQVKDKAFIVFFDGLNDLFVKENGFILSCIKSFKVKQ